MNFLRQFRFLFSSLILGILLSACNPMGESKVEVRLGNGANSNSATDLSEITAPSLTGNSPLYTGNTITCTISYDGDDITPTFYFYNSKDTSSARSTVVKSAGIKSATYDLKTYSDTSSTSTADIRGDQIVCRAELINDDGESALTATSTALTVDDSAPVLSVTAGSTSQTNLSLNQSIGSIDLSAIDEDGDTITINELTSECSSITLTSTSAMASATGTIGGSAPSILDFPADNSCSQSYRATANALNSNAIAVTISINSAETTSSGNITVTSTTTWTSDMLVDDLTVDGTTLTLAGGHSYRATGTITLMNNATLVFASASNTGQVGGEWVGAGTTLYVNNLTIANGSKISANGQGYIGGVGSGNGQGPGGGEGYWSFDAAGAGYGGDGGRQNGNVAVGQSYGRSNALTPTTLGSGGGSSGADNGGNGGGAIRLNVTGTLDISGSGVITANGEVGAGYSGAGSGGSIYITTNVLQGNGTLTATGGSRSGLNNAGGSGGGGRIAVYYQDASGYTGFTGTSANGGGTGGAEDGSVVFIDTSGGSGSYNMYVYDDLELDDDLTLNYNNITIGDSAATQATLSLGGGSTVNVSGTLYVTASSTLTLRGKNTSVGSGGEGVTINAVDVTIDIDSKISADEQGYDGGASSGHGKGPGAGQGQGGNDASGAGYGGIGGTQNGCCTVGPIYDLSNVATPTDLGSGGGASGVNAGGDGGGAIRMDVTGTLTLNGEISADGASGGSYAGGGSGGSVYVTANVLTGSGKFTADGGERSGATGNNNGSGGGGRIAVYYQDASGYTGWTNSTADGGQNAADGTVGFFDTSSGDASTYDLRVYKKFQYASSTTINLANITVDGTSVSPNANLIVGGGTTLNLSGNLTLNSTSTLTAESINNTAQVGGSWQGQGITINAVDLTIQDSGSSIDADEQGYIGGISSDVNGKGPGGGQGTGGFDAAGAGYGGDGQTQNGGLTPGGTYDGSTGDPDRSPTQLGSGGGSGAGNAGGAGGGAIAISLSGRLTNNGTITADGGIGSGFSGAGSGGSIYIDTDIIVGATTGLYSADGGNRTASGNDGGSGGGGRIAIFYNDNTGDNATRTVSSRANNASTNGTIVYE